MKAAAADLKVLAEWLRQEADPPRGDIAAASGRVAQALLGGDDATLARAFIDDPRSRKVRVECLLQEAKFRQGDISPAQCRAERVALGWDEATLARAVGHGIEEYDIERFEEDEGACDLILPGRYFIGEALRKEGARARAAAKSNHLLVSRLQFVTERVVRWMQLVDLADLRAVVEAGVLIAARSALNEDPPAAGGV